MQGQPPPSQRVQNHINSRGFQERFFPDGHHWRGGSDHGGIQVPGLQHRCQVGLATERPGPLEEGQPAAVLHEEAESFSACPKLLELFQVSTSESVLNSSLCHFSILKEQDWAWLSRVVVVVDRFYITLFSSLEQTHYAPMWFYMSD